VWTDTYAGSYRPDVSSSYGNSDVVLSVIKALEADDTPEKPLLRDAVRQLLTALSHLVPGRSVEVRVPPFGAVQCIPGPRHTRGTPPAVIETDGVTWINVATGRTVWRDEVDRGTIRISGNRTDLSAYLPLPEYRTGSEPASTR
jgi:hypothetical protein